MNATRELRDAGVSIWLDDLSRGRIRSGELDRLIAESDVVGITTNPTIFAAAFAEGVGYREQADRLRADGVSRVEAALALMTDDVRAACDTFRPVFDETGGWDGRVSIEVSPVVAHDADATLAECRHLRDLVGRPNLFVKIPATRAGVTAIEDAIAEGISINVTLIFGLERYRQVIDAYAAGLERARAAGLDLGSIHSVASFFVSRVDVEVDRRLEASGDPRASELRGRAAVANARLAYDLFEQSLREDRWRALAHTGANLQRPLWASTGVKDARLRDTLYVEELVAPRTVDTMPEKTLDAVRDHGRIRPDAVTANYSDAHAVLEALAEAGISMDAVSETLETAGIATFGASWERLLAAVWEEEP